MLNCFQAPIVFRVLGTDDEVLSEVAKSELIKTYLRAAGYPDSPPHRSTAPRAAPRSVPAMTARSYRSDIDSDVLRPENQNQTYVTPYIEHISKGLTRALLRVGGQYKEKPVKATIKIKARKRLMHCLAQAKDMSKTVFYAPKDRRRGEFWNAVNIDHRSAGIVQRVRYEVCLTSVSRVPN